MSTANRNQCIKEDTYVYRTKETNQEGQKWIIGISAGEDKSVAADSGQAARRLPQHRNGDGKSGMV
jgi:hypothetical protein